MEINQKEAQSKAKEFDHKLDEFKDFINTTSDAILDWSYPNWVSAIEWYYNTKH